MGLTEEVHLRMLGLGVDLDGLKGIQEDEMGLTEEVHLRMLGLGVDLDGLREFKRMRWG